MVIIFRDDLSPVAVVLVDVFDMFVFVGAGCGNSPQASQAVL